MTFHLLYIDPGTGSMLFSILIGAAATLYFVARAVLIKLKLVFSGGVSKAGGLKFPYVIYCEGRQYFNVFKPALDEFERRETEILYLTSAEDDPVFDCGYRFVKPEFIGAGNKAFARLNLLQADLVLMTTPGLDVYQLKRSKMVKHYSHILHAPSDATMYKMFGTDYFDSVLLSGDYQAKDIRKLEQLRSLPEKKLTPVGCPYLDVYAEKIKSLPEEAARPFTVLVSPSWGPSSLLCKYGERLLGPLIKTGWKIIARPHPQSKKSEPDILDKLQKRFADAKNLEWDYERENIGSLSKADIMISDFSGIIYDFIFLRDKPVMYVNHDLDLRPYDADDLGENAVNELWQFKTLKKIGIELREEHFSRIQEIISAAADNAALREERRKAKAEAWFYQGESGKKIYEFMVHTKEALC